MLCVKKNKIPLDDLDSWCQDKFNLDTRCIMSEKKYSIKELAELANVSRRTVRYYVQKGLLDPPKGQGRGSFYDSSHLSRLIEIRDLQQKGVSLSNMNAPKQHAPKPEPLILPQEQWTRIVVSEGIEIHLSNQQLTDTQIETIRHTIALLLPFKKESL